MFLKNVWREIKDLIARVDSWKGLGDASLPLPIVPETVDCETCGCMVKKENAIVGEGIIKHKPLESWNPYSRLLKDLFPGEEFGEEYIHKPYYCKRCAPKKKKEKAD